MHYVYVLKSQVDKKLYIGFTGNIKRRLEEHNNGENISTKFRKPFKLIYCEVYLNEKDARIRELKLKKFKNSYSELKKRITNSLDDA